MSTNLLDLLDAVRRSWPSFQGLLLAWLVALAAGAMFLPLASSPWPLVITLAIGGVVTLAWLKARQLKRCPPDKFGFVVAISVDDPNTQRLFERDFSRNLESLVSTGRSGERVWAYRVPQLHLPLCLTQQEAMEMRQKTNAGFLLYGQVRTRKEDKTKHYVDLHGVVGHAETVASNKTKLVKEFTELLPRRLIALEGNQLVAFELSSSLSSIVAKYIAGIGCFLSGALDYANDLYIDAQSLALPVAESYDSARKIVERVPVRLTEVVVARASAVYQQWRAYPTPEKLVELREVLGTAPIVAAEKNPVWRTLLAICSVASDEADFDKIEAATIAKENARDPITQMNLAFFDVVRGDLRAASRHYRRAAELNVQLVTIEEVICFLEWFQGHRPALRAEVSFALGFISYHLLGDKQLTEEFFSEFRHTRGGRYEAEAALLDKWIGELDFVSPQ